MRYMAITVLALMVATAAAASIQEDINAPNIPTPPGPSGPVWGGPDNPILWDNGPLITGTCPANIPPGAESQIFTGRTLYGYGQQFSLGYRVADDFTVPVGQDWNVQAITFYAYQTGNPTSPSSINHVSFQLWDGRPDLATSTILCGDLTTNVMALSVWSGIYRTTGTAPCDNSRAVMADVCVMQLMTNQCPDCPGFPGSMWLTSGTTYWLDWTTGGTRSSGPWIPPITPPGGGTPPNNTQNAGQYTTSWQFPLASGPDDFPFIIEGDFCGTTPVDAATWGQIKSTF